MCRRAGRMELGFDSVKEALEKRKARLVILAADVSPKTEKEVRFYSGKTDIKVMRCSSSMEEFGIGIGKKVGVIAVCDDGFAKKSAELLDSEISAANVITGGIYSL